MKPIMSNLRYFVDICKSFFVLFFGIKPLSDGLFNSLILLESFVSLYFAIAYQFYRSLKVIICMGVLIYRNLAIKVFKTACELFITFLFHL